MDREPQISHLSTPRRIAAGLFLGAITIATGFQHESVQYHGNDIVQVSTNDQKQDDAWKLVWRDSFDGNQLSGRWKRVGPMPDRGIRLTQYDTSERMSKVRGGKLILRNERRCDGVPSIAPCPEGTVTTYRTSRIEEIAHSIAGDYRLVVKARLVSGAPDNNNGKPYMNDDWRAELWGNTGDNYCIEGKTDLAEFDMAEINMDEDVMIANNIVHCDNGKLNAVPRKQKMEEGWVEEVHEYVMEREGNNSEFFEDGEAVPMRANPNRSIDKPKDFIGVTKSEFMAASRLNYGFILSTYIHDDPEATSKSYQEVDDSENYYPGRLLVYKVEYYSK